MFQPARSDRCRGRRAGFPRLAIAGILTAATMAGAPVAHADTLGLVRAHIHRADAALHKVVAAGSGRATKASLTALEGQLRAAGSESAKLYRSAHAARTSAARVRAASATTKLAAQDNRDATVLTPLLRRSGPSQNDLAVFVASVTQGREQALSLAAQLISQLPASARHATANVVAQLSDAGASQVGQLAGAIPPGSIACPAVAATTQLLAVVLTSIQSDLTRVQSILPLLPSATQSQFTSVVAGLPTQLRSLLASVAEAFDCASTTPVGGSAAGAGSIVSPLGTAGSLVDSITQLGQSLLTSFLPGVSAGQTPQPVTVPGPVSGLLAGVTSLIPGLGSLFGDNSSTGLGGLPGLDL
jgi:methylmalonyl-CoA mutase cobalamin-binding subunit